MTAPMLKSAWMTEEHEMLEDMTERYAADRWTPNLARWREQGMIDRKAWNDAGEAGLAARLDPRGIRRRRRRLRA